MSNEGTTQNIKKIFWLNSFWMLMIIMPILVPYFQGLGLTMKDIFQLQSIFSFLILVFEIPSGYLSDLVGRKYTLVIGSLMHGIGYTIFPFADGFWTLVIAEIFLAIGASLFSGTDISLLYDSIDKDDKTKKNSGTKLVGELLFYKQSGEAIAAIICSIVLIFYTLKAPVYLQSIAAWVPLLICLGLKEPLRKKMSKTKHKQNFIYIYNTLFKDSKILKAIGINMAMYGVATLLAVWLFQNYWTNLKIDLLYFGLIWAALNFTVGIIGKFAHKIEATLGSTNTIILIGLLPIIGYLGMGLSKTFVGIIFCFCFQVSRGLNQVILKDALNKRIGGDLRATSNSIISLIVRLIFIIIGPLLGYMIDFHGENSAYYFMGLLYILIFVGILLPFLSHKDSFTKES